VVEGTSRDTRRANDLLGADAGKAALGEEAACGSYKGAAGGLRPLRLRPALQGFAACGFFAAGAVARRSLRILRWTSLRVLRWLVNMHTVCI
jgi:hypothetical protein